MNTIDRNDYSYDVTLFLSHSRSDLQYCTTPILYRYICKALRGKSNSL
uniref:Uncharacterized protein n=1 Tax=Anguilla anguilla TaxID=7936 RepID=A0A0E9QUL8_ANGAN